MRVLGIYGSLRRGSLNSALLRAAAERLPAGAELVECGRLGEIPPYDADIEEGGDAGGGAGPARGDRRGRSGSDRHPRVQPLDAGALKNALDWASRPAGQSAFKGNPAAVIGASTGMFGAVWAQAEIRKVLGAMGGRVVEANSPSPGQRSCCRRAARLPPEQAERLEEILAELVAAAERVTEPVAA